MIVLNKPKIFFVYMVAEGTPWWKQGEQNAQRGKEGVSKNSKTIVCIKNFLERYLYKKRFRELQEKPHFKC
jgi:hypothetical protein